MHRDIYLQDNTCHSQISSLHFILLIGELRAVTSSSILGQVVESVHHAAAQSTAGDLHVMYIRPLIRFDIIALDFLGGGEAVEAPDHKEAVVDHGDAKVAAGDQHGGHIVPGVGVRVVGLSRVQTTGSIETADLPRGKVKYEVWNATTVVLPFVSHFLLL